MDFEKIGRLPTRERCQDIVKNSEAFFCTETVVEGQKVEMYNYRLASITDFVFNDAFELRGITFIQGSDGTWERNILLQKFFNVNQTTKWMYEDVKDKKIVRIQNKEDGSIISFCRFENGKVRAKSKMSFISEQAQMAQDVYDKGKRFQSFMNICFRNNFTPIFELVGYENQIVLNYNMKSELRLLQVRDENGEYLTQYDIDNLTKSTAIKCAEDFVVADNYSIEELLQLKETSKRDIEGWVVTFEDGQMAKIKTDHYLQLHGLIGPDAFRENLLVKTILDGNIDDVISALVQGPKKDMIIEMEEKVSSHFNHLVVSYKELRRQYFQDFKENKKDFALAYSKGGSEPHELFSAVVKSLNTSFKDVEKYAEAGIKDYMLNRCNSLGKAKEYLENL